MSQVKVTWRGFFRELPDDSRNDKNADFGELLNLFCPLQWLLDCWFSPELESCWFSRPPQGWGEGYGNKASKNRTELIVLREIHLFLLNNCTSDFYRPLVNFWNYEKVDFNHFTTVTNACMETSTLCQSQRCRSQVSSLFNARDGAKRRQLPAESFEKEANPNWR